MGSTLTSDPYQILGVAKDATVAAIRSAHRKLVLQTHPDKIQDESQRAAKQDEFQRIQQAYEILTDEVQRQQYDDQARYTSKRDPTFEDDARTDGVRFEVRTAAPSREFDRLYEERRARRSADEDLGSFRIYDEVPSRRHDGHERPRPSRRYDDRRAARAPVDDYSSRIRIVREQSRQMEKENISDRRRNRERERRRGHDEKYEYYARVDSYEEEGDDDDEHAFRRQIEMDDRPRRKSADLRRREGRSSDETIRRETPRRRGLEDAHLTARKMSHAREYMEDLSVRTPSYQRSPPSTTYYDATPPPPPPPPPPVAPLHPTPSTMPLEDTVRRSSARRSSERDRARGSSRSSKSSRKEHIQIVEPAAYEPRSRVIPGSSTSPSHGRSSSNARAPPLPQPHRSATMYASREPRHDAPSLSRASTMPVQGAFSSSRRRDAGGPGSSKLKSSRTEVDSGYSSPGTPEMTAHKSPSEYIVVEEIEVEPRMSSGGAGRRRRMVIGSDDESDEHQGNGPSSAAYHRGRRPPLNRTESTSARFSPGYSISYASGREASRPTVIDSSYTRKESAAATRASPSSGKSSSSGHHARWAYPEVQYSPRIGLEDVVYGDGRRGSTEGVYRDAAPHHSRSHYVHGPHHGLMRAETSI